MELASRRVEKNNRFPSHRDLTNMRRSRHYPHMKKRAFQKGTHGKGPTGSGGHGYGEINGAPSDVLGVRVPRKSLNALKISNLSWELNSLSNRL